jgi:hypothetical protein
MKQLYTLLLLTLFYIPFTTVNAQQQMPPKYKVDTRVDNMGYWQRMAKLGLVSVAPFVKPPPARFTSSKLNGRGVTTDDSPDVPVTTMTSTQSENSIFVNPADKSNVLNSNNSTPNPVSGIFGANDFYSFDEGHNWEGELGGAGGENSGDPTTAISNSGRYYIGYIDNNYGQSVSYSDDQGATWTPVVAGVSAGGSSDMLDKNHMWIDNSLSSPFNGYLYDAWTSFGGVNDLQIEITSSSTNGTSWTTPVNVSSAVLAGSHNQGVNLHTGPNGEAYAIWAIYDDWPVGEGAIGFTRSLDGGNTWDPGTRIQQNILGIRNMSTFDFQKNMRINSFPCMTVDISNGPHRGDIYVIWSNIGVPGINTGTEVDVYMIRSTDQGLTWSAPIRINQDAPGFGKQHFSPWITCDPANGNLSVVFYDDRDVSATECEVFVANSTDGGTTWTDFKVSDVAFTPQPIAGLADMYFGDYLGITAFDRNVYPCWTDNRSGEAMTYVSPYTLGPPPNQPYVVYSSDTINDAASGNGNGMLDFGESVRLNLGMTNIGDQPATNVNVEISTASPYITLSDSTENFGDFTVAESKSIADAFAFSAAPETPDGTNIVFKLTATDANDSIFVSNFGIEVHSPAIAIGSFTISDPLGNNNGRLDPGETADLIVDISNPGDFDAVAINNSLTGTSPFVIINNTSVLFDTIHPGQTKGAVFSLTVDAAAPIGSVAGFDMTAHTVLQTVQKSFSLKIGLTIEDWETGDFTKFPWVQLSDSIWTIDSVIHFEGNYSARSGAIDNLQVSEFNIPYEVMNDDSISFYRKVSSENNYDFLQFYLDGNLLSQWSGEQDWERVAFPVSEGPHTFKWTYMKDVSMTGGMDAAWVDYIVFPPRMRTTAYAGTDASICRGETFHCQGEATSYTSVSWSTSGSGTFDVPFLVNAIYTPGSADLAAGMVTLTLTVNGTSGGEILTDDMVLSFISPATANAGNNGTVCEGFPFQVSGSSATNYQWLQWYSLGDGHFSKDSILMPTYTPGHNDGAAGMVVLTMTVHSGNACPNVSDNISVNVNPLPTMLVSAADTVCQGDSVQVTFTLTGIPPWTVVDGSSVAHEMLSSPWTTWIVPKSTTTFNFISIMDSTECINNNPIAAEIFVKPSAMNRLGNDTIICANHSVTLNATWPGTASYFWTPGGQTIASITVDSTGTGLGTKEYSVTVLNESGCQATFRKNVTFSDCSGIDENVGNVRFSVYPNPGNGKFYLQINSPVKESINIQLVNILSQAVVSNEHIEVYNKAIRNFDLRNQGAGTYILTITNGNFSASKRIIIQ